jgi:hypothetical protein
MTVAVLAGRAASQVLKAPNSLCTPALPYIHCKTNLHTIAAIQILAAFVCSSLSDYIIFATSTTLVTTAVPGFICLHHRMNKRLAIVVLFTLCIQPAVAADSVMGLSPFMPPMGQFYTDPEGTLRCIECVLCAWDCVCSLSQSSSSPYTQALSNECSFYDPPLFADDSVSIDLSDVIDFNNSSPYIVNDTFQSINVDATTLQTSTIQAYVDGTYLPGYRQQASPARPHGTRHVPCKGGFVCTVEGCNKAFDRKCELNRHLKIHLSRNERPYRCSVCSEGFLYPKDLVRHGNKHTKQNSAKTIYHCHVAGCSNTEGFSRRDNLLRHHRRQHGSVASPPP